MINIIFNEKQIKISNNQRLIECLQNKLNMNDCFAVMLNKKFISRSQYVSTNLAEGDIIEIVVPMQGG